MLTDILTSASGDLRNVLNTINVLPPDYTGKLTILMNDRDQYVTLRNILILQILARVPNKRRAADLALHLWYSAFMPMVYQTEIVSVGMELSVGTGPLHTQLGSSAVLDADISKDLRKLCGSLLMSSAKYGMADAANELNRVR